MFRILRSTNDVVLQQYNNTMGWVPIAKGNEIKYDSQSPMIMIYNNGIIVAVTSILTCPIIYPETSL